MPRLLAFVTNGALLGIKPIRRDAEHVVALDADSVNDRADDGAGFEGLARPGRRGGGSLFWRGFSRHGLILARGGLSTRGTGRHPGGAQTASFIVSNREQDRNLYGEKPRGSC